MGEGASTPIPHHPFPNTLDGLASLVDKSLVQQEEGSEGEPRFSMLEAIREFALERLVASNEEAATRDAHATHCLDVARAARERIEGPDRLAAHDQIALELDNLRAALTWAETRGDAETAQRLANELARFWVDLGYIAEARDWSERVVAMPGESTPETRAEALHWAAGFASWQGMTARAIVLAEEALRLSRATGFRLGAGMALTQLGHAVAAEGDLDRATTMITEALGLFRELRAPIREGMALRQLGMFASRRGDHEQALEHHQAAQAIWRRLDHPWGIPAALRELADEAVARGDLATARAQYQESLTRWRDLRERLHMTGCFLGLARVAVGAGQAARGARLLGVAQALEEAMGCIPTGDVQAVYEQVAAAAQAAMGEQAFAAAWAAGRALPLEQVVAEALADGDGTEAAAVPSPVPSGAADLGLTPRELEVLRLIAEGRTDQAIADDLFVARRTVTTHVSNILAKLNVESRSAAAAIAVRRGLV